MKVKRAGYIDDGIFVPGVVITRLFRKPVFYSVDARCGWQSQVIYKGMKKNLVTWDNTPQPANALTHDADVNVKPACGRKQ